MSACEGIGHAGERWRISCIETEQSVGFLANGIAKPKNCDGGPQVAMGTEREDGS